MDSINFNFVRFPNSIDVMEKMHSMIQWAGMFAKFFAGQQYIIDGCEFSEATAVYQPGIVSYGGEVLPFEGGYAGGNYSDARVQIVQEEIDLQGVGETFQKVIKTRRMVIVSNSTMSNISIKNFAKMPTITYMLDLMAAAQGSPIGSIVPFVGRYEKIPNNFLPCDGRTLDISQYTELYDYLGEDFALTNGTQFHLPDMRGRYLKCIDNDEGDVTRGSGGSDQVTLELQHMPRHRHVFIGDTCSSGKFALEGETGFPVEAGSRNSQAGAEGTGAAVPYYTTFRGGGSTNGQGLPFTINPPFYKTYMIIKAKNTVDF